VVVDREILNLAIDKFTVTMGKYDPLANLLEVAIIAIVLPQD
jgi:hypothetical protein